MLDKFIEFCPFRVHSKTTKSATIEGESYTTSQFYPCLKGRCPAYHSKQGNYGAYIERCRMFDRKEQEK